MARASRVMRLVLAAATIAVCLLLCWQAVDIYRTGNSPDNFSAPGVRIDPVYSREIAADRLGAIAPALLGYVVLAAAGLVLEAAAGEKGRRLPSPFLAEDRLRALRRRVTETPAEAERERRRRRSIRLIAAGVVLACIVLGGAYLLDGGNFASLDLEAVVGRMVLHVAPWAVVGLIAAGAAAVLCGRSVERETDILKAAPQQKPASGQTGGEEKPWVPILRAALYGGAAVLVVLGVRNGGMWDVLVKAVNICTECIGLG